MYPQLYVIAGPNGIGKSTSAFDAFPPHIPIINSDEIAATARNAGIITANTQEYGNREAVNIANEHLANRNSFAIETNLADVETWKFIIEVQKTDYQINMLYISCDDQAILNSRIEQRVLAGEHYVRPDIVEERYINGLKLLDHYFLIPDTLKLFDNAETLVQVAEIHKGIILSQQPNLPEWVKHNFSNHLYKKEKIEQKDVKKLDSVDEVKEAYKNSQKIKRRGPRL